VEQSHAKHTLCSVSVLLFVFLFQLVSVVMFVMNITCLIIITILLLLKTMSNKISLIALKRTIRVSLKLIDSLTSDRTNTWGTRHKIPRASPLKSSNLLSLRMLPFRMKNDIAIRS
jgi:hypothetical protein